MSDEEKIENAEAKNIPSITTVVGVSVGSAGSDSDPDTSALKELFSIALETRNFEISQLVQRNNFFMVFQGVLLAGVVQSAHTVPVVSFLVCLAAVFVSIYQVRMAAGAKFWQEYWEQTLHEIEKELVKRLKRPSENRGMTLELFHEKGCIYEEMVKNRLSKSSFGLVSSLIMNKYSVSKTPIYVALSFTMIWILLLLCTMRGYAPLSIPSFIVGFK